MPKENQNRSRKPSQTGELVGVDVPRLVRCVWRNFAASMIMNPILGVFLVAVCNVGGHPGIERAIAAMIGLNMGWILGMAALLFVARFDPANSQDYDRP